MAQATTAPGGRQAGGRGLTAPANLVSLARLPMAAAFVAVQEPLWRVVILAAAAASDLLDGWLARRFGGTRLGAVLDPVTDKIFMLTAFALLGVSGALSPLEVAGVLLRDVLTPLGWLAGVVARRPFTVPARAGGKAVTVGQSLTLFAWILDSRFLEPLAWATAAMALYAIADYGRLAVHRTGQPQTRGQT